MKTNTIVRECYRFINFATFEIVDFYTDRWTLVGAISELLERYDAEYEFAYVGRVTEEYPVCEDEPEADAEGPEDWDDEDGPAWCEETGWYE